MGHPAHLPCVLALALVPVLARAHVLVLALWCLVSLENLEGCFAPTNPEKKELCQPVFRHFLILSFRISSPARAARGSA